MTNRLPQSFSALRRSLNAFVSLLALGFFVAATAVAGPGDGPIDLTRYGRLHKTVPTSATLLFSAPAYTEIAAGDGANPLPSGLTETFSTPSFGDIDGDGDFDVVSGEEFGGFVVLENTGDNANPSFTQLSGVASPLNGVTFGTKNAPALVDIDNDGDLDIIVGQEDGTFALIENSGDANTPTWAIAGSNPLNGEDNGSRSTPTLGDLDGDGDYDLASGDIDGTIVYYENQGTAGAPVFVELTLAANPFDGIDVGDHSKPALVDIDNDNDLDLVVGEDLGGFFYFENTGDANTPSFSAVVGAGNPFDGFDAGDKSAPAFADLDNATGVDMASGNTMGDYYYYENADPLPVELTSFSAVSNGNEVTLTWTTASETNNAGFEIQQRVGRRFEVVGWVDGAGTSTEARSYSFTTSRAVPGRQAFRLRQVDFDGAFSFSTTREVSVAISGSFHMGDVFPNPFNPQATFTLTVAQTQNVTVAVYDMQGRMVSLLHSGNLEAEQPYQFQMDGGDWASGKYLIRAVGERFESSRIVTLLK
ncbi:MAG: FG-GAP-like repeat-containing protein [Rhodothermales bacterium]